MTNWEDAPDIFLDASEVVQTIELSRVDDPANYRIEVLKGSGESPYEYYSRCWRLTFAADDRSSQVTWEELRRCAASGADVGDVVAESRQKLTAYLLGRLEY